MVTTSILVAGWAMVTPVSAAGRTEPPDDEPGEPVVSVIDDPRVALSVTHRADWVLSEIPVEVSGGDPRDPCLDTLGFELGVDSDSGVRSAVSIELVPADCDDLDDRIGNGWHGLYRSIDDVPDPIGIEHIETPVGPAVVFDQEYYECTNECRDYTEPVAIVSLDDPADERYPSVVIRDDAGQLDADDLGEDEFTALLDGLARTDGAAPATTVA